MADPGQVGVRPGKVVTVVNTDGRADDRRDWLQEREHTQAQEVVAVPEGAAHGQSEHLHR